MNCGFSKDTTQPVLQLRGISKSFNGIDVLQSIDLDLYPGEILGLIGDNGAGKSTLIKILSGIHKPDHGSLLIGDREVDFGSYDVRQARMAGIETVFQDRSLGEKQSLWRNTFLGRPITNRFGFIRVKQEKETTLRILNNHVGLQCSGISPDAEVRNLSGGERQGLAIGRAMYFNADIVILDEPTTALSLHEVDKVLNFVAEIPRNNKACIYISHNMNHIYHLAHRILVLDRGKVSHDLLKDDISGNELAAKLMEIQKHSSGQRAC